MINRYMMFWLNSIGDIKLLIFTISTAYTTASRCCFWGNVHLKKFLSLINDKLSYVKMNSGGDNDV